jgi:predicted PurR-regulated permease PerM
MIGLILWGIVAVGLIDNFLGPRLVGRGMRLHPLLVILSVLGGATFLGPVGFIFGPLAVSLFFALLDIYTYLLSKASN